MNNREARIVQLPPDNTTAATTWPLVSIGLPTYNRAHLLPRSVASLLAQDYPNIEIVISDNASSDGTQALCEEFCRKDSRVRYIRQSANIGIVANHSEVFRQSRGAYYMTIGDDDWLDANYVSQCIQVVLQEPDVVIACGRSRLFKNGQQVSIAENAQFGYQEAVQLTHGSGDDRIIELYKRVTVLYWFQGVTRRDILEQIPPMRNVMMGDQMFMASLAYMGKIKTVDSTAVNYSLGGASASLRKLAQAMGLPKLQADFPYLSLLFYQIADIMWASPVYSSTSLVRRVLLSCRVVIVLYNRRLKYELCRTRWLLPLLRPWYTVRKIVRVAAHISTSFRAR